jgi:NAD(P)-dependent dehydrogenase (short-subunit alcohol dehydrogenase family)/acyl carrier protein
MVWGLGRVLAAEAPDARVSFVELDAAVPDWNGLGDFIASGSSESELAIVNGRVLTPALAPMALPAPSNEPRASELASYLVTGAFGFIGGLTTRWLVEQGAGKLFLVGHNPPHGEALAAIEAARKTGTEIETITLDISNAADVGILFERIEADSRPLKGIIHSAAALDDASISRQTPASLSHALGAKARGAWLLHERSSAHSLDFFVLYSSAAAVLGTPGQANYAAANCYLDALAHHRRDRGLTALSLNWGLWEKTGLAVKRDVQAASTQGIIPISAASGMAILGRAICSGETQVSVLPFDWVLLRQALGARRPPTLLQSLVVDKGGGAAPGEADGGVLTRYAKLFETASASERSDLLLEFTRSRSCELLGLDPSTVITDDQPLLDLGIDSLTGLELRNNLQTLTGVTFPSTLFFDCPTFGDLRRYFQLIGSAKDRLRSNSSEQEFERISI